MNRGTRVQYSQLSGLGFNMFTDDELDELHSATLDVLEDTGIMVAGDEAQELFYSHGCKVDKKTNIVKIPPYLVEEAISSAPAKVLMAGRNPENDVILGGKRVNFTPFSVAIKVLDLETGEVRDSTNKDLAESTKLCDATESVDIVFQPVSPTDAPIQVQDMIAAETSFNNTSKHFMHCEILTAEGVRRFFEMGVAVAGGEEEMRKRPVCSISIDAVSPLQLVQEDCEVIVETARSGMPLIMSTMALAGATAPVTLAGTLIVNNVEVLGGITLSQLARKGAPVIYTTSTTILDLRDVSSPVGNPELGLISAAVAQLSYHYKIPSFVAGT